jgi:hypothetical protein
MKINYHLNFIAIRFEVATYPALIPVEKAEDRERIPQGSAQ